MLLNKDKEPWKIISLSCSPNDSCLIMTDEISNSWESSEGFVRRLVSEGKIVMLRNIKVEKELRKGV